MWEPQLRGKPASTKIKIYFFFLLSSFSRSEEKQQWYLFKSLSWSANKSGLLFRCWCALYLLSQRLWSCCHGRINQTSVISNPSFMHFLGNFLQFFLPYVSCFCPLCLRIWHSYLEVEALVENFPPTYVYDHCCFRTSPLWRIILDINTMF